jgi:transmembrane sensor
MLDDATWERIARYALGECSAAEAVETRAWIEADPERMALAEELIRLADAGPTAIWDARRAWQRFSATMGVHAASPEAAEPAAARQAEHSEPPPAAGEAAVRGELSRHAARRRHASRRRWLVAASVAAMLLASSAVTWRLTRESAPAAMAAAEDLRTVATQPRQTAEVYLSDGTRVVLGPASTLRFPARFRAAREVQLEGEAYFDVADEKRLLPWRKRDFTVRTERAVVRDLGTRFSVRALPGSTSTEVVVAEGAVSLAPATRDAQPRPVADSLILTQADLGRLDADGGLTVVRGVDVAAHHAWLEGRLVFTDTPVAEVVAQFRRWYGVDLRLGDDALAAERLTGAFETASAAEALELLAITLDARLERRDGVVVLHRERRGR